VAPPRRGADSQIEPGRKLGAARLAGEPRVFAAAG
jgi:hypothetical protein